MASGTQAVITGTGAFIPEKILTNEDLEKMVETSDEWITQRTGIKTRHMAGEGTTCSDMAAEAGRKALADAGVDPTEVDLVILGTFTGDRLLPATACYVQHKLGAVNAGAFDLAAACSGFIYSMSMAYGLIKSGIYKTILVIGADLLTTVTNYEDRASCILFGDGAGAVVLQADSSETESGILAFTLGADGSGAELMTIRAGGTQLPVSEETLKARDHYMTLRGREVFKFAANKMQELVRDSLAECDISIDDVKLVVPHQVNRRILDFAAAKLGLSKEKMFVNIDTMGNTSAASVPMALDEARQKGQIEKGDIIVMVAFGGGLTWASMVVRW